jgi:hypothetical protein
LWLAAWNAGRFGARWSGAQTVTSRDEWAVFSGAVSVALAWAFLGGAILRGDRSLAVVTERMVIDAPPAYRLAALATGWRGGALSAVFLLALALMFGAKWDPPARHRRVALLSGAIAITLATSTISFPAFAPSDGSMESAAVPVALLHPAAAWRAVFTLSALVVGVIALISSLAARAPVGSAPFSEDVRRGFLGAWLLATLALAADQWARASLAMPTLPGTRLDRNATGIVLWLVLSALVHERSRSLLFFGGHGGKGAADSPRLPGHLAHAGALLVIVAFGLHLWAVRTEATLTPGRPASVRDRFGRRWRLVNEGLSRFDVDNREIAALAVDVTTPTGNHHLATTERRKYRAVDGSPIASPVLVRATVQDITQQLLLTLQDTGAGDESRVEVVFVPLAALWIPGVLLLSTGGSLAFLRRGTRRGDERPS